jgi:hypothetical protein
MSQHNFPDSSDRFRSLDDIWILIGQEEHQQIAVMEHFPQNEEEIQLQVGDVIQVHVS